MTIIITQFEIKCTELSCLSDPFSTGSEKIRTLSFTNLFFLRIMDVVWKQFPHRH